MVDARFSYSPQAYAHNVQALARVKMCLLNEIKCPPRPMIISGWWYIAESVYENGGTTGEVIWMKSVVCRGFSSCRGFPLTLKDISIRRERLPLVSHKWVQRYGARVKDNPKSLVRFMDCRNQR